MDTNDDEYYGEEEPSKDKEKLVAKPAAEEYDDEYYDEEDPSKSKKSSKQSKSRKSQKGK